MNRRTMVVLGLAAAAVLGAFAASLALRAPGGRVSADTYGYGFSGAQSKNELNVMDGVAAAPPSPPPAAPRASAPRQAMREEADKKSAEAPAEAEADEAEGAVQAGIIGGAVGGMLGGKVSGAGLKRKGGAGVEGGAAAPATRAWFPETFLFEPLVVTNAQGHADVAVKVPDRLTSWRVLALAHSRQGGQAGALASFLGTLPTYVEPVVPAFLLAGDRVRLPIQLVNTTDREVAAPLGLTAAGATLSSAGGTVRVPAGGDAVQYVELSAPRAGKATLRATLGSTDAVEREIPVQPAGLRTVQARGGTLAGERTFTLTGPADALPGTEALRVRIVPGALGLLRSELSAAPGRGGVAEDAYLLQLLGQAPALLRNLGATPDEPRIRELTLLATQRVMQHARAPSADAALLLAEATASHPDNPVLARVAERLAAQVARSQRADGTCQGESGWTLQRLLVATAECVRAVRASAGTEAGKQRATQVAVKAGAAFERNLARVGDAYTAAALLASGTLSPPSAAAMAKLVVDHLATGPDGARSLPVDKGVVRPDGRAPSSVEATALAVLALGEAPPVADLGTFLMAGYSASWGWGDGRANLVALRAAVALFKAPVPAAVTVSVARDGAVLASGAFDAAALKDVLALDAEAPGSAGDHAWSIKAEPPVPGLGFSLQLVAFTPWREVTGGGLSLTAAVPAGLQVGRAAQLTLTAGVPGGTPMRLQLPLPAGVQHDTPSLDALVSAGQVSRYETEDGLVTLHLPAQRPGAVYTAALKVVPTLAGRLQAAPPSLAPEAELEKVRRFSPSVWTVKP